MCIYCICSIVCACMCVHLYVCAHMYVCVLQFECKVSQEAHVLNHLVPRFWHHLGRRASVEKIGHSGGTLRFSSLAPLPVHALPLTSDTMWPAASHSCCCALFIMKNYIP